MSVNHNRKKFNKAENGRQYRLLKSNEMYPIYWDECISFNGTGLMGWEMRMYKTWKYNRKNQWK